MIIEGGSQCALETREPGLGPASAISLAPPEAIGSRRPPALVADLDEGRYFTA
jgi:hypothetical protein